MAVVLSAYDLIVRVEALGDGMAAFVAAVPNQTFCSDGQLARVSFMVEADRERFIAAASLPPGSVGRADRRTERVDVDWLEAGRHAGVAAVWLRGVPRDPLVVPMGWAPGELTFESREAAQQHLELLGVEDNVEVYLDKRTGQKVYTGRTQPPMSPAEAERLEALRRQAIELTKPVMRRDKLGFFERRRVKKGIALFEQILETVPDHWMSRWMIGMSLRALVQHEAALAQFRRAYASNPGQRDVGREYAGQCFIVGCADEGLRISRALHARFPDDVGLQSNLALALLLGGDLAEAEAVADAALAREPNAAITNNLLRYIRDVRAGRTPRPPRMPGLR